MATHFILRLNFIASIMLIFSTEILNAQSCHESDAQNFFDLLNAQVATYLPPLDRDGNILLSETDMFIQKSQHYYNAYKEFAPVHISMERFASVTENNPNALENFESKITIIGPDCSQINLYRSRLVGSFSASFAHIMRLVDLGVRTNNQAIIEFSRAQLTPKPLDFSAIMAVLANDLALEKEVIDSILPNYLKQEFAPTEELDINSLSELALLAFSFMGGQVFSEVDKIYIFAPAKTAGLDPDNETVILASDGKLYDLPAFDYKIATIVLKRLGIRTSIVTLTEVKTASSGHCKLDMGGTWMQVVNGHKIRMCPFPELVRQMLQEQSYRGTDDHKKQGIVFDSIDKILNQAPSI